MIPVILPRVVVESSQPGTQIHGGHVVPAKTKIERPLCAGVERVLHIPGVGVEAEGPRGRSTNPVRSEWQPEQEARHAVAGPRTQAGLRRRKTFTAVSLVGQKGG